VGTSVACHEGPGAEELSFQLRDGVYSSIGLGRVDPVGTGINEGLDLCGAVLALACVIGVVGAELPSSCD
jgi:hypothetical protein